MKRSPGGTAVRTLWEKFIIAFFNTLVKAPPYTLTASWWKKHLSSHDKLARLSTNIYSPWRFTGTSLKNKKQKNILDAAAASWSYQHNVNLQWRHFLLLHTLTNHTWSDSCCSQNVKPPFLSPLSRGQVRHLHPWPSLCSSTYTAWRKIHIFERKNKKKQKVSIQFGPGSEWIECTDTN